MNAYEFLITHQTPDTLAGEMALGMLITKLRKSLHASTMTAVSWPAGWRCVGSCVVTPDGTMLVMVEDHSGLDVRGARYQFDVVRVGSHLTAVDGDPPRHLTAVGVNPIKAALWSVLGEWGTESDRIARDALL